ncbi:hypothetical protein G6F62_014373 [Rhizopus arrhizus]|nr:hypothetical protein G6F62_014373 [Rhizopus arrhizus]
MVGPGLVLVRVERPPRGAAQLAPFEVAHLVRRRRGHRQRLLAPDVVLVAAGGGTGFCRLQRGQRLVVGQVGAAQGAQRDVVQPLLFDRDRAVPGGVGHHRDR